MLLFFLASLQAHATWSIVAADPATGELGGAGTSCVGELDVSIIYGSASGKGAVHAQAALSTTGRDEAVRLLGEDTEPDALIDAITAPAFDPGADRRQYGVVDLQGRSAGFTGDGTGAWAGHTTGTADGIVYVAAGNILTGEPVVSRTAARFDDSDACDLPGRLMDALTAGRAAGEGDSRCTDRGIPSDSAFLRVEDAHGVLIIDLSNTATGSEDPLAALQVAFDAWRVDHPCPEPPEPTDDTDADEASAGCGCSSSHGAAWLGMLAVLLVGLRRR